MPAQKASARTASLPKPAILAVFGAGLVLIGKNLRPGALELGGIAARLTR